MHSVSHVLLALLAFLIVPAAAARPAPQSWRLDVARDTFAGRTNCHLATRDRSIRYQPGAIGFRFPHRRDTLAALYRIDDGAPLRWQDYYATLAAAGVHVDDTGMDDPTAGIVWLPQAELASALTVSIRLTENDRPTRFALSPIAALLADATRQGCVFAEDGRR